MNKNSLPLTMTTLILSCVFFLISIFNQSAHSQSILDNPLYQEYERMNESLTEPATPTPRPTPIPSPTPRSLTPAPLRQKSSSAPKEPLSQANGQIDLTPITPQPPAQQEITLRASTEPRKQTTKPASPVSAVIDVRDNSLSPQETNLITQAIWNEVRRSKQTQVQAREYTQYMLDAVNMVPGSRRYIAPSRYQMARALEADYLYLANAGAADGNYAIELMLYSAANDQILASAAASSKDGLDSLLKKIPQLISEVEGASLRHANTTAIADDIRASDRIISPLPAADSQDSNSPETNLTDAANRRSNEAESHKRSLAQDSSYEKDSDSLSETEDRPKPSRPTSTPTKTPRPKNTATPRPSPTPAPENEQADDGAEWELPSAEPTPTLRMATRTPAAKSAKETPVQIIFERTPVAEPTAKPTATTQPKATAVPTATPTPAPTPTQTPRELTNEEKAAAKFQEAKRFATTSEDGIKPLLEAVQLDPKNAEYQRALVTRLYYTGQYAECIKRGNQFIKAGSSDPMTLIFVGAAHTSQTEYAKALSILDQALKADPNNGYALFNRALNLDLMNDPRAEEAFRYYLRVARNNPSQAQWVMEAEKKLQEIEASKTTPTAPKP